MFCRKKKNLSVRRKKKKIQSVEREKKCKCRISGVRKKKIERKVPGKKIKVFWVEILLSSYSLVELCVNLQVKVTEKKMMKIFKVFFGWVFEVKIAIWGER